MTFKKEKGHHKATSEGQCGVEGMSGGVHYKPGHACFGKSISLCALHMGLFVSRLLSVHYNSHIQKGELAKPVI